MTQFVFAYTSICKWICLPLLARHWSCGVEADLGKSKDISSGGSNEDASECTSDHFKLSVSCIDIAMRYTSKRISDEMDRTVEYQIWLLHVVMNKRMRRTAA